MNTRIQQELKKCKVARIPKYDENTEELNIPSRASFQQNFDENTIKTGIKYHMILEDYIIHPYNGFTLHDNWNNGVIPTDAEMICEVTLTIGKMTKISGVGVHSGNQWSGWVPIKSISFCERV